MQWATAKALLGWYAARCAGPRMVSPGVSERVSGGPGRAQGDLDHMRVAAILATCTPGTRRAILAWATVSDEAQHMGPMSRAELRRVVSELRRAGLLSEPVRAVRTEVVEWVDADTGEVRRTRREKRS